MREQRLSSEQVQRICQCVDENFDRQVAFLKALVRIPSLRQAEEPAQMMIARALEERGYAVDVFAIDAGLIGDHPAFSPSTIDYKDTVNVVGWRAGTDGGARSLALNAHVDIVPTGAVEDWASDPFEPSVRDGWLYGRGAGDMKAGLTANIFALDALADAGLVLRGKVQVQSVIEEEITGNGAAMALALGYTADAVLIPEPTGERLVCANSGVLKFAVTVHGIPTHPMNPKQGRSAIDLACRVIDHLKRLEDAWNSERFVHPLFASMENPVSLTIGTICGGEWIASTPSLCRLEGRIGFYPGEDPRARAETFEQFLVDAVQNDPAFAGGRRPKVEWVGVMHAGYELAPGSQAEACLEKVHRAVLQTSLERYVMPCYLDAAVFSVHGHMPALVYGPLAEKIHGFDERVNLASLRRVTKTIALFAASWCGVTLRIGDDQGAIVQKT